jgi:colanic acid biosynthesis glycosyl transferase WcaI
MTRPRVYFLNRFYWPDEPATAQLLRDLCSRLVTMGFDVRVITGRPVAVAAPRCEVYEGVHICRVRSTHWGRRSLAGRAVDFLSYQASALLQLLRLVRPGDRVVALTDPPLLGIFACVISTFRGAVFINWVQDIYPEVAMQITKQKWLRFIQPMRNFAWRHSRYCVVPGTDMAETLLRNTVPSDKITISPNWAPAGLSPAVADEPTRLRQEWGLTGKFVLLYSGNLGRVHDLAPLLDVAEALVSDVRFAMVFVGHGGRRAELEASARARSLTNVSFHAPQSRHQLGATLRLGDVHFVTLLQGAEHWVFPSKLYGIAEVGRPVIFIGQAGSEIARMVEDHQLGWAFDRTVVPAVVALLKRLVVNPEELAQRGEAGREFARDGSQRAAITWSQVLCAELAGPPLNGEPEKVP